MDGTTAAEGDVINSMKNQAEPELASEKSSLKLTDRGDSKVSQEDSAIVSASQSTQSNNGEIATIPKELLVKHPLQHEWVLWYLKNEKNQKWEDSLKKVASFRTVEDFWALYNHIQLPSNLSWGSDYSLFKKDIQPTWEDDRNVRGGRWLIPVEKMERVDLLDHYWLELLIAVIGEQFDDMGDIICGCVVNIRPKGDKISMWLDNSDKEDPIMSIGRIIKDKLKIPERQTIKYESHEDTKSRRSSHIKSKLMV